MYLASQASSLMQTGFALLVSFFFFSGPFSLRLMFTYYIITPLQGWLPTLWLGAGSRGL